MILCDADIRSAITSGRIKVESRFDVMAQVGPASLDFRLGNSFKWYKEDQMDEIDPNEGVNPHDIEAITVPDGDYFVLNPGDFILGVTAETISIPRDMVARCEGRSSLGRLGLLIHSTAGFIDPGFAGTITLEITNVNTVPIRLYPGMRIGQFSFETLTHPCEKDYAEKGGKYMNQTDAQESRIGQDGDAGRKAV